MNNEWYKKHIYYVDGLWYWADETGAFNEKGLKTYDEAVKQIIEYADYLNNNF